ncbi:MAG: NAD(P)/FAD-dependent oxidoreductase [Gracilimonas sp.]|nr:NAD(P)/FAD-dependent oxidoreductase [Gracilimonas sp.]
MKNSTSEIPVLIVGGGPVGLFLAIALLREGIRCKVLEKRIERIADSRSLGIHPVSLELFDELGITAPFLKSGLKIKKGIAFANSKKLGEIQFTNCPGPHNYILACPQNVTENILRDELTNLNSTALITDAEFIRFEETESMVDTYYSIQGNVKKIKSQFLIGCDGKNSQVRKSASIHYSGKRYPDTYIMGDFEDTTSFNDDAAVFLTKEGLIECFPLPNGMRRWVVKTDDYISDPTENNLASLVQSRIGYNLFSIPHTMLSSFGVQHLMAETYAKGRILLAGDSAHVVSPIGGQGMNLGWLDAWELVQILRSTRSPQDFQRYSKQQQLITKKVARRAEVNMRLGRAVRLPYIKEGIIQALLLSPLQQKIAELFTMRGLSNWWF